MENKPTIEQPQPAGDTKTTTLKKVLSLLFSFALLIAVVFFAVTMIIKNSGSHNIPQNNDLSIDTFRKDGITYIIFIQRENMQVVNYTQDSLQSKK